MPAPTISVVINTLNEETNLPAALQSIAWADEIIVVDMHSDDRTREIAEAAGARVFLHERLGFSDPARAFALAQATKDWVLILDADELVTPTLAARLKSVAASGLHDVVRIPRLNYLLGARIMHTGWGAQADAQLRFFRSGSLFTTDQIHNFLKPVEGARIHTLRATNEEWLVHFNYLDVAHFFEKLNRYTTIEARQARERGEKGSVVRGAARAAATFVDRFVFKAGFLDGWRGFVLSCLMATYRFSAAAKLRELDAGGGREASRLYADEAKRVLAGFPANSR